MESVRLGWMKPVVIEMVMELVMALCWHVEGHDVAGMGLRKRKERCWG